ncbi:MAG: PEP-CTERM sorting domain-containing protein [Opitutaceae bacterium]|nr:PEP-CTERM sorting domain-containing protein [Opitutaceae bacterium]
MLDNFLLTCSSPIPEPSTVTAVAGFVALLAVLSRRRH